MYDYFFPQGKYFDLSWMRTPLISLRAYSKKIILHLSWWPLTLMTLHSMTEKHPSKWISLKYILENISEEHNFLVQIKNEKLVSTLKFWQATMVCWSCVDFFHDSSYLNANPVYCVQKGHCAIKVQFHFLQKFLSGVNFNLMHLNTGWNSSTFINNVFYCKQFFGVGWG